jgi:type 1 fimbriae regulatory protein FimB/type 1 fimbriae regulatory protein FimE
MTKPHLRLVTPTTENRTVSVRRPRNGALRTREHLTIDEVERLIEAAKNNRYGHRDALMVLLAFRHGLRAGEICDLRGSRSTSKPQACMSGASKTARLARIP